MTLGDIANKARALTHTDTTSYTAANLLIDINIWYVKIVSAILESMDEAEFDDIRNTNYPIQTTPMIAVQRDYTMPVSEHVLKLKRVDVTYDGTHWFKAEPLDDGEFPYGMGSDTEVDASFIREYPRYSFKFNSIWLYPMPQATDVAAGGLIRAEWDRNVITFVSSDYTTDPNDSTVIPGIDPTFHPMLSAGAALEKAKADGLPQLTTLQQEVADWEVRLRVAYGRKEKDRRLALGVDGSMFNSYR